MLLGRLQFHRIIFDEGQKITPEFRGRLHSHHRWVLTATPFSANSFNSIQPILNAGLGLLPYCRVGHAVSFEPAEPIVHTTDANKAFRLTTHIDKAVAKTAIQQTGLYPPARFAVDIWHEGDAEAGFWCNSRHWSSDVSSGAYQPLWLLAFLCKQYMFRHVKHVEARRDAALPPKTVQIHHVALTPTEAMLYRALEAKLVSKFKSLDSRDRVGAYYTSVVQWVAMLRRSLIAPATMLSDSVTEAANSADGGAQADVKAQDAQMKLMSISEAIEFVTTHMRTAPSSLRECLVAMGGDPPVVDECIVCSNVMERPVMLKCGHLFCRECVFCLMGPDYRTRGCPNCRSVASLTTDVKIQLKIASALSADEERKATSETEDANPEVLRRKVRVGSKVKAAVDLMKRILAEDPTAKFVVFSGFADGISAVFDHLLRSNITSIIIDGTTTLQVRGRLIASFQSNAATKVCIVSARAGNAGITLTAANHLIMLEPNVSLSVDTQVLGRLHRVGQQRPVVVHRMICPATIEERIQFLLDAGALGGSAPSSAAGGPQIGTHEDGGRSTTTPKATTSLDLKSIRILLNPTTSVTS